MRLYAQRFISGQESSGEIFIDWWALPLIFGCQTNIRTPCIPKVRGRLFDPPPMAKASKFVDPWIAKEVEIPTEGKEIDFLAFILTFWKSYMRRLV